MFPKTGGNTGNLAPVITGRLFDWRCDGCAGTGRTGFFYRFYGECQNNKGCSSGHRSTSFFLLLLFGAIYILYDSLMHWLSGLSGRRFVRIDPVGVHYWRYGMTRNNEADIPWQAFMPSRRTATASITAAGYAPCIWFIIPMRARAICGISSMTPAATRKKPKKPPPISACIVPTCSNLKNCRK